MGDLGNDVGQAMLNASAKVMEAGVNFIKYLLDIFKKDYNQKIAKYELDKIKLQDKVSKRAGYINLKKLRNSGFDLTQAKCEMTKEQMDKFLELARKRKIPVSSFSNGKNEQGVKTYIAVFRTMDKHTIEDITEQLVRDIKIENIEKLMKEKLHYEKKDFESAIEKVDGKLIDKETPVIICDRTNPTNHIIVSGTQETYNNGEPYVASLYEVYSNGEKLKSDVAKKAWGHNEFKHHCDGEGRNSSDEGKLHWENLKDEMKEKGEFTDDILIFENKEEYQQYVEQYANEKEQAEKDSQFYDELKAEKDKIVKDDVDHFNEKQTQSLFAEISGVAKEQSLTFADTVDHFQVGEWEKEEPYYICKRTDPDNYIEVQAEQKLDSDGKMYNEHTYNIYVDDVQVKNPHREDGRYTDERYEGRPADYWKNMKEDMQKAGDFTNDCVVFANKQDYLMYREIYQQEHSQIKDPTLHFETDKNGIRNDFGYVQSYLESCKKEAEAFNNIDFTNHDGSLNAKVYLENETKILEGAVINKQVSNYQAMVTTANELVAEKAKLEAIENSDLRNSDMFESMRNEQAQKIEEKTSQMKELQVQEEKLWQEREQITGAKSELQLRREEMKEEITENKTQFSSKELKEFANSFKEKSADNKTFSNKERTKSSRER